jgi:hypothetical protein
MRMRAHPSAPWTTPTCVSSRTHCLVVQIEGNANELSQGSMDVDAVPDSHTKPAVADHDSDSSSPDFRPAARRALPQSFTTPPSRDAPLAKHRLMRGDKEGPADKGDL